MGVLLELERRRPAVLDSVAEPVQGADARIPAPGEDQLPRAAHPDQLVADQVGRHADEREVFPPLPDQLVAGRVRDQVREALERDDVAVVDEGGDRVSERKDLGHQLIRSTGLIASPLSAARTASSIRSKS